MSRLYRNDRKSIAPKILLWLSVTVLLNLAGLSCSPKIDDDGYTVVESVLDPQILPWEFDVINRWPGLTDDGQPTIAQYVLVTDCGNGSLGMYDVVDSWRRQADTLSSLILYADVQHARALAHYNIPTSHFTDNYHGDFDNDGICDVAVMFTFNDTAYLAIYNHSTGLRLRLALATGDDRDNSGLWDGNGQILADYDVNGDGVAELLVGIDVGYDLYPRLLMCIDIAAAKILWHVEVASIINSDNFFITPLAPDEPPVIVAAAGSKGNTAVANGMDDLHSYLLIVDLDGKMLYQRQVGGMFSRADPIPVDVDSDGHLEIILPTSTIVDSTSKMGPIEQTYLLILGSSGELIDSVDLGRGGRLNEFKPMDLVGDDAWELVASFSDGRIILLDQHLRVINKGLMPAAASVWNACDFLARGDQQLFVTTTNGSIWLLELDFSVLAQFTPAEQPHRPGTHYRCQVNDNGTCQITLATDRGRMHYILALSRTPWTTIFSRHPTLAFLAAAVPLSVIIAVILLGWLRGRRQNRVISRQRDHLDKTLADLRHAQKRLVAAEEFQKAQHALAASEERFRELADLLPQMVFEIDVEGRFLYANLAGFEWFGYTDEDLEKGVYDRDIIVPEEHDELMRNHQQTLSKPNTSGHEYTAVRKDETRFPILVYSAAIIKDGRPVGVRGIVVDMTELKQSQQALGESEEKYRVLVESAGEAIFTVDREERILFMNRVAATRLGGVPADFEGQYLKDLFPPQISRQHRAAIKTVFETGEGILSESNTSLRGAIHHYLTSLQPLRDHNNRIVAVLGIGRDVTDHKRALDALRESEEKFRGIFDESIAAVYLFDTKKNFIDSNQSGLELLGYSRGELLSMSIPDVDADPAVVLPAHRQLLTGGRIVNYEHRLVRKDGRVITVLNNSRPLLDFDGAVIGMQSTLIDITERKLAEEAIRESEQRYATLVESAQDGILVVDAETQQYIYANPAMRRMLGYSLDEVMGLTIEYITPEEGREAAVAGFQKTLEGAQEIARDIPLKCKDGHIIYVDMTGFVQEYAGRQAAIGFFRDITERKRHEKALGLATEERFQQAKSIAGGIAHEIYNALFPASSGLAKLEELLRVDPLNDPERNLKLLHLAQSAVRRAVESTDLIKVYSRLESERSDEQVSLCELAEEVLAANADQIEDLATDIQTSISSNLTWRMAHQHAFSVLNNLVQNALDAMADSQDTRLLQISGRAINGGIQLTISDNGSGIPPQDQPKIFRAFFSTKPTSGTGLGLAMVKRIVELYQGRIEVHSHVDKGTDFVIFFVEGDNGHTT